MESRMDILFARGNCVRRGGRYPWRWLLHGAGTRRRYISQKPPLTSLLSGALFFSLSLRTWKANGGVNGQPGGAAYCQCVFTLEAAVDGICYSGITAGIVAVMPCAVLCLFRHQ
ncbi:hypothetical protein J3F84DRAFT_39839 [Trichoderma pleuroticola]